MCTGFALFSEKILYYSISTDSHFKQACRATAIVISAVTVITFFLIPEDTITTKCSALYAGKLRSTEITAAIISILVSIITLFSEVYLTVSTRQLYWNKSRTCTIETLESIWTINVGATLLTSIAHTTATCTLRLNSARGTRMINALS
jgi:hypothetical protein